MSLMRMIGIAVSVAAVAASAAHAQMRITEWQYNGSEYVEFTNLGGTSVDMTNWSFSDSARTPGNVSLAAFGTVLSGESVLLAEEATAGFKTRWNLPAAVDVIGSNGQNLGRADEINLYSGSTLIDRLTYDDQTIAGSVRTQNISGNPISSAAIGANNAALWVLAAPGDRYGSYTSVTGGFIGNPGVNVVPEPASLAVLVIGVVLAAAGYRRTR